jgi:hypothetical protein
VVNFTTNTGHVGVAADPTWSYPGVSSLYADDTSFPVGTLSFTAETFPSWASTSEVSFQDITAVNISRSRTHDTVTVDGQWGHTALNGSAALLPLWSALVRPDPDDISTFYTQAAIEATDGVSRFRGYVVGDPGSGPFSESEYLPGAADAVLSDTVAALAQSFPGYYVQYDEGSLARISPVGGAIDPTTSEGVGWTRSFDYLEPSQAIRVYYYTGGYSTISQEVYPEDVLEATVFSVEAGQTVTQEITTPHWIVQVNQPQVVDWVESDKGYYDNTPGVYSVVGSDGLPVTASQWTAQGGRISVSVSPDDSRSLLVTITGPSDSSLSPYRIAMSSGNQYSSLRITAECVKSDQSFVSLNVDPESAKDVLEIDNLFLRYADRAYSIVARLGHKYGGMFSTLSGQTEHLRPGDLVTYEENSFFVRSLDNVGLDGVGSFVAESYPVNSLFESVWEGLTMEDFESVWGNGTMGEFEISPYRRPL